MRSAWQQTFLATLLMWAGPGVAPASALDFHDPDAGFSLTLPPGWSQLSAAETAEALDKLQRQHKELEAAFIEVTDAYEEFHKNIEQLGGRPGS